LHGEIHPIFRNWVVGSSDRSDLLAELQQPLLLASRILEAVGYQWLSSFFPDEGHGARGHCEAPRKLLGTSFLHSAAETVAEDASSDGALESARVELSSALPRCIVWQLDADMFREKGWVGYTARHPRTGTGFQGLDAPETIEKWDRLTHMINAKYRSLAVMVMQEYPARLRELRRFGLEDTEEYIFTAFMAAVTVLHE